MIRESLFQKKAAFWLGGHFDRLSDQRENGLGGQFDRPSDQRENGLEGHFDRISDQRENGLGGHFYELSDRWENGLGGHFYRPSDRWGKFSDRTKETGPETGWLVTEPVRVIMLFTRCLQ